MKRLLFFLSLLLLPWNAFAAVKVVATLPVFASLARAVGGERVTVTSLARANQDPHFLDAKPSYVVTLSQADLLIHGGLDLEVGWIGALLNQARNPKLNPGGSGNVDASRGLDIIEIPSKVDRAQGDIHPNGNPHTWLSPDNGKVIAANIYKHLVVADPDGEAYYKGRLEDFVRSLNATIARRKTDLAKLKGLKIITYHKSLGYFAKWAGVDVIATVEPKPGIPPNSKHVDHLIGTVRSRGVKAVVMEEFYPRKIPEYLAEKANVPLVVITNTTGSRGADTYEKLIEHIITELSRIA